MTITLNQLRAEWTSPCPALSAVRERYFSHISSDRYLIRKIHAGDIPLKFKRLGGSNKGTPVVYLHDLAEYLDAQAPQTV